MKVSAAMIEDLVLTVNFTAFICVVCFLIAAAVWARPWRACSVYIPNCISVCASASRFPAFGMVLLYTKVEVNLTFTMNSQGIRLH